MRQLYRDGNTVATTVIAKQRAFEKTLRGFLSVMLAGGNNLAGGPGIAPAPDLRGRPLQGLVRGEKVLDLGEPVRSEVAKIVDEDVSLTQIRFEGGATAHTLL